MKAWFFLTLGNIAYTLNGRLNGLEKDNWLHDLMIWAWAKAWYLEEKTAGRIPQELPMCNTPIARTTNSGTEK